LILLITFTDQYFLILKIEESEVPIFLEKISK
jgi:hypothetical protein